MTAREYGLRVNGDDLAPYAKRGCVLVVEPDGKCIEGECVVLTLTTGQVQVRELVEQGLGTVTVSNIDRSNRETLSQTEVVSMLPITAVCWGAAAARWGAANPPAAA